MISMNRTHLFLIVNTSMMKNGAPSDKFGVLHCPLPIEFHGFTGRILLISKGYHSLVPGII